VSLRSIQSVTAAKMEACTQGSCVSEVTRTAIERPALAATPHMRRSHTQIALLAVLIASLAWAGCGSAPSGGRHPGTQHEVTLGETVPKPRLTPRRPVARPHSQAAPAAGQRPATGVPRPPIRQWPIPFAASRKQEMAAYSQRHYGRASYRLVDPKVIVEHYTETSTAEAAYNTFAPDTPDPKLHELPNVCAHFLVDREGTIYQLVPLSIRCRHTVGLNYTAIGIEHVGSSDQEILANRAQFAASLGLTRWLRCRFGIALSNVIGHNESLSSPYHRELVPSLRSQTHGDWNQADMDIYRAGLRALPC
jgi:N-acetylmuramoyl-L-alanine amidase